MTTLAEQLNAEYPRDMIGYGRSPPHPQWPGDARIALQFVLNYEEGSENSVLHGDAGSEQFLSEILGAETYPARHMSMESIYEYGSRAGFWRVWRLFTQRGLPLTVFGTGMALLRNPEVVAAMKEAGWEICSHGWRWIHYQEIDEATEREHFKLAVAAITEATGERPLGWYTGRDSPNTRRLCVEHGGFLYDSDYYGDDLPLWMQVKTSDGREVPHLVIPYTLDANDMRFVTGHGFRNGQDMFMYLKDAFDVLYAEGQTAPRMMSVGLHCRLVGRPGRAAGLERFLDYVQRHERVWVTRRVDIARHWRAVHPFVLADLSPHQNNSAP